jgi:hypothetical protein
VSARKIEVKYVKVGAASTTLLVAARIDTADGRVLGQARLFDLASVHLPRARLKQTARAGFVMNPLLLKKSRERCITRKRIKMRDKERYYSQHPSNESRKIKRLHTILFIIL